jgi:cytochrome c-type biogenesis protein CcmE
MTITDYLNNRTITEKSELTIVGTIKPRSVRMSKTAMCKDFVLTDNRNELECTYNGMVKSEFK